MKKNKGFTLIELLISMIVSVILMFTICAISGIGNRGYKKVVAA